MRCGLLSKCFDHLLNAYIVVASSALSCTYNSRTYGVGTSEIEKSPCEICQCRPRTLYSSSDGLICHVIRCPVCPNHRTPDGQCCPRCTDVCESGVEITNCPSGDVRVPLPARRNDVLYRFVPTTRDCENQGRTITTTKTPRGNIYQWNGAAGHEVTVTATGFPVTCKFKIIPVGKFLLYLLSLQLQESLLFDLIYCWAAALNALQSQSIWFSLVRLDWNFLFCVALYTPHFCHLLATYATSFYRLRLNTKIKIKTHRLKTNTQQILWSEINRDVKWI